MKNMKQTTALLAILFFCTAGTAAYAAETNNTAEPDNTQVNVRDRDAGEMTADQQKENEADRDITQRIRKMVMQDKSLSSYAHNIKIISQNGIVTLKGPVKSTRERKAIVEQALSVTGSSDKVIDEISIKRAKGY
jgi:hyperosmotically inducible protein